MDFLVKFSFLSRMNSLEKGYVSDLPIFLRVGQPSDFEIFEIIFEKKRIKVRTLPI